MRVLKKAKKTIKTEKIKFNFFVFDTETTKLEPMPKNFVFGVIYGYNYKKVIYSVEEFILEFQNKRYKNKYVFAHNAEFDLLTIFGNIFTEVDNAAIFNGKFISAKKFDITFCDSLNIYPTSVEKIGKLIDLHKGNNEKIRAGKLTKDNITEADIEYCIRDCKIVFEALLRIFEMTGAIKITLPSLAMHDYRLNYIFEDLYFSDLVDEFYESYYGGRTEAFIIGKTNAKVYDINSLYPFAMKETIFPDINKLKKDVNVDVKYLMFCLKHYEGLAKVRVFHKDCYIGYLPFRDKKLLFPVGEFETVVNFNELRFAIDSGIVKILSVEYVIYAPPIKSPFVDFVTTNYNLRMSTTDELNRTIYKLKMNSLYGRFAMKIKSKTTYYDEIPYDLIVQLKEANKFCDVKIFSQIRNDCFLVTDSDSVKNSFHSIPVYSSYITSEARIILLKNLLANEKNGLCYCDTDSVFLTGEFEGKISDRLGEFKEENKIVTEIRGLKNYTYEVDNVSFDAIKGVSKNSIKTIDNKTGNIKYSTPKYYKTLQSLRNKKEAGQSYVMTKVLSEIYDKRIILNNGDTKPIKL